MIIEPEGHQTFASPGEALEHFGIKGMRWGFRKDREHVSDFNSFGEPYDAKKGNGQGIDDYKLKKTDKLRVDRSEGFDNVRSAKGFKSEEARQTYEGVVSEFKKLRETYPEVADLKVEVVPMSHFRGYMSGRIKAAVMHSHNGEVTIGYNDNAKKTPSWQQEQMEKWIPGTKYPGYVGTHEMGHVLAVGKGLIPPTADIYKVSPFKQIVEAEKYDADLQRRHKDHMARNGLTFKSLHDLGDYAKTSPSEAFAEAFGSYHTPELRAKMSPARQAKIKAMLDDKGGKS